MSNTSTGLSTMSKNNSTASTAASASASASAPTTAKRVTKKADAPTSTASVAAPAAASVAAPAKNAAAPKQAEASAPAPVAVSAPVVAVAAAPVASSAEVPAEAVEVRSVEQEINDLVKLHQNLRDEAVKAIKNLQKLQKRVAKEIKEASRRRRRSKKESEDGVVKEKRPTIFTTPVTLKDDLCAFLGKPKGFQMIPADVTRAFSAYVNLHKLKDVEKGHTIHPDPAMRKVLGVKDDETVTYRNIQTYLYKLYVLPEKKKPVVV